MKNSTIKIVQIDQKPFKCTNCRQRFRTTKNIRRHMQLKHSQEKPKGFQCVCCKKLYQNKGNHDAHYKKVHIAEHLMYMEPEIVTIQGKF